MEEEAQDKPREYAPKVFLSRAELAGYKSIKDVKVDLHEGLNIIIGDNGSGKSNFLEFLYKAVSLDEKEFGKNITATLFFNKDNKHHYLLSFKEPQVLFQEQLDSLISFYDNVVFEIVDNGDNPIIVNTTDQVNSFFVQKDVMFSCQLIKHGVPVELPFIEKPFTFEFDRYSLNSEIRYLFEENIPYFLKSSFVEFELTRYQDSEKQEINEEFIIEQLSTIYEIKEILKQYSPIEDIKISDEDLYIHTNEKTNMVTVSNLFLLFKVSDQWLPFSSLSDGTKRLFYIIAEIAFSGRFRFFDKGFGINGRELNRIILLEEPELGIHPHQLDKLMDFLREQSKHKQIIITTHSPQVLDILKKDELDRIIIAKMGDNGTELRHLKEEEISKARNYMEKVGFLSDYWRLSDLDE